MLPLGYNVSSSYSVFLSGVFPLTEMAGFTPWSWGFTGAKFFYREHALAYPQPQFFDMSGPTKQLSWQPHH